MRHKVDVGKRFWSKVEVQDLESCWPWKAARFKSSGYGAFNLDGESRTAHSVAYELSRGAKTDGPFLRHTCHRRDCVNPAHLVPGTHADNMRDMSDACRARSNKTSWLDRERMMSLLSEGMTHREVAARYGITPQAVAYWEKRVNATRPHRHGGKAV